MKKIYIAALSFVFLLVLTVCDREEVSSTAIPEVTVHSDGKVILSQITSREVGTELDDESTLFQALMKDSAASILVEDGMLKYNEKNGTAYKY